MNASSGIVTKAKKTKTSKIDTKEANSAAASCSSTAIDIDVLSTKSKCSRTCSKMCGKTKTVTVFVKADIGWGNKLFIRGEGACLSWENGMQMTCMSSDMWMWTCETNDESVAFKILINDEMWCVGDNYSIATGSEVTITPVF